MTTKKGGYPETIHQSLVALRGVLTNPEKNSTNPAFGSKYAKLEDIIHHVRGPLSENGLTFVQHIITEERTIKAQTILIHASGETMTLDGPAVLIEKFTAHGTGSAATYAKRYSLCTALGIESDADDDGNAVEETFESKDTKKPPPKKTAAKKAPPKKADNVVKMTEVKTAKEGQDYINSVVEVGNFGDEDECENFVDFLLGHIDAFHSASLENLSEFYRNNTKVYDLVDGYSDDQYKVLSAHMSALKKALNNQGESNE